jgi:hypothetical protein
MRCDSVNASCCRENGYRRAAAVLAVFRLDGSNIDVRDGPRGKCKEPKHVKQKQKRSFLYLFERYQGTPEEEWPVLQATPVTN